MTDYTGRLQKIAEDKTMRREMIKVMSDAMRKEVAGAKIDKSEYAPAKAASLPGFIF